MATDIRQILIQMVVQAVPESSAEELVVEVPPKREMGDFGIPCFQLARKVGLNPVQTAQMIEKKVILPEQLEAVRAVGPYINFFLKRPLFTRDLCTNILTQDDYGSSHEGKGKTVVLEHTSINPNASPHIGRSRNALIGDCLARLLRFQGYAVEVHYYVNDMGKQIALLVMACQDKAQLDFDEVLDIYVAANKKAEQDPEFEKAAFELLRQFEQKSPDVTEAFFRITDISIQGQLKILHRLGITYDFFDRESDYVHDPSLDEVFQTLEQKGVLFTDEDDRLVADLRKLRFEPDAGRYFVIRRANGSSLYGYRDIAYNLYKLSRGGDRNIVVFGEDHKLYHRQICTILRALDRDPPEVVHYSYVVLKEGKMSTRRGTVVLLTDFIDEAIERAHQTVNEAYADLPETERQSIAEQVGIGAVKFSMLKVSPTKNVTFDWQDALSFVGDTGPYLQYTCARIMSIYRKYGKEVPPLEADRLEVNDAEWELLLNLSFFGDAIQKTLNETNSSVLANYALDVAKKFNSFYHECPVLQADNEHTIALRLNLCLATHQIIKTALSLLGIEAPERM